MSEAGAESALAGDAELMAAIRAGDTTAYGELYQRHVAAAQSLARQLVRGQAEVDDVVAETFSKVLDVMRRGGGPQEAFRPYLLTAVRRVAYDRHRGERRSVVTDEIETYDPGQPFVDPAVAGLERSLIARAFLSLPERWRAVLWHTEIEEAKPADVAPLLGLTANGVAALAYRAREGLRQAYLQMHLTGPARPECRPVVGKLGAFVRGGLAAREAKVVTAHLDGCPDCRTVYAELADVNSGLRAIVAPIFLGPLAAAYLAALSVKGGALAGWLATWLLWLRHAPRGQQAMTIGGTVATAAAVVAAVVVTLALAGSAGAALSARRAAAAPPPTGRSPSGPRPRIVAARAPVPEIPPAVQPSRSATPSSPPVIPPPRTPSPPVRATAPPVRLSAQVDPAGALLPGSAGLLAFSVTDGSHRTTRELSARITLPPGVSFPGSGTAGSGTATAGSGLARPGQPDLAPGWACGATTAGVTCTHGPLAAGQAAPGYLRVAVTAAAPLGPVPTLTVRSGGREAARATGSAGVSATGLAARFAATGRLDTIMTGNVLPGSHCPGSHRAGSHCAGSHRGQGRSASAALSLPGGVVWAGLYWSGPGAPGHPALGLLAPGGGYQQVSAASTVVTRLGGVPAYQAYADVTDLVAAGGSGTWRAALTSGAARRSAATGWTLVVVARDPAAPSGQTVVLDGARPAGAGPGGEPLPLDGLFPPGAAAEMQSAAWNGLRYGADPALISWRELLPASRSVALAGGGAPGLAGVVAAGTSADTTQLGPRPRCSWPGSGSAVPLACPVPDLSGRPRRPVPGQAPAAHLAATPA